MSLKNIYNNAKEGKNFLLDGILAKLNGKYANLAIWIFFLSVSVYLLSMNIWKGDSYDLNLYNYQIKKCLHAGICPVATKSFVYPVLALIPMSITELLSGGDDHMYNLVWLLLSIALNSAALYFLLNYKHKARLSCLRNVSQTYVDKPVGGSKNAITRKSAAIYWISFMLLMGPIYLSRIDIMQIPLCVIGVTFLVTRTELTTLMFTVAAWMKVFAGAFVIPLLFNVKKFFKKVLLPAGLLSVGITAFCVTAFKNLNVFSFLTSQSSRGLQIESPAATPLLVWETITGKSTIYLNRSILTNELGSSTADFIANQLNYIMVIAVLIVCVLIYRARKYDSIDLFCYGGLSLVTSLILFNKVGSPQYYVIIPVAIIAMIYYGRENIKFEVIVSLFIALFTWLLYPTFYTAFLDFDSVWHPLSVLIVTVRNVLSAVLFVRSVYRLYKCAPRISTKRKSARHSINN